MRVAVSLAWGFIPTAEIAGLMFLVALSNPATAGIEDFTPPQRFTDSAEKYRLSRASNLHMAIGPTGRLHATYWSGSEMGTTPARPSYVYYRFWEPLTGWAPQERIDESEVSGLHLGGRHPSLALTPNRTVWILWSDSRNCTAGGNWNDNTEIYGDFKTPGGSFSEGDFRFTTTAAAHNGDNSLTPRIVSDALGRLSFCWFDFHHDPDIADIFLRTSSATGEFELTQPIDENRLTDLNERGGGPSYSVPDMAIDSNGTRHLVWVGGFGAGGDLVYAELPLGETEIAEQVLAVDAADFFDPPHITVAPNDDVWIVYGDDSATGSEDLVLRRKLAGQNVFDASFVVASGPGRQISGDAEVDSNGVVHLVWLDENAERHIHYGRFDPTLSAMLETFPLTEEAGNWIRPTLLLDGAGEVYVMWEENVSLTEGDLWFATTARYEPSAVGNWGMYR